MIVPAAVSAFRAAHPHVELEVDEDEPTSIVRRLRRGELDIGLVHTEPGLDEPSYGPPLHLTRLCTDSFVLVVPLEHRLARRKTVALAELYDELWVAAHATRQTAYRRVFEQICATAGFEPRVVLEADSPHAGQAFVAAGVGVLLVTRLGLQPVRPDVHVVQIRDAVRERVIWAATIAGRKAPAAAAMLEALHGAAQKTIDGSHAPAGSL